MQALSIFDVALTRTAGGLDQLPLLIADHLRKMSAAGRARHGHDVPARRLLAGGNRPEGVADEGRLWLKFVSIEESSDRGRTLTVLEAATPG